MNGLTPAAHLTEAECLAHAAHDLIAGDDLTPTAPQVARAAVLAALAHAHAVMASGYTRPEPAPGPVSEWASPAETSPAGETVWRTVPHATGQTTYRITRAVADVAAHVAKHPEPFSVYQLSPQSWSSADRDALVHRAARLVATIERIDEQPVTNG
jgi:hypothetical protein